MVSKKSKKTITKIPDTLTPITETSMSTVQALPIVATTPIVENSVKMFFTSNIGPIIVFTLILVVIGLVVNYVIYPLFVSNDAPTMQPRKPIIPQTSNPKTNQPNQPNTTQPNQPNTTQPNQPNTTQPNQPNPQPTQKVIPNCGKRGILDAVNNICICPYIKYNKPGQVYNIKLFDNDCNTVASIKDIIKPGVNDSVFVSNGPQYRYFYDNSSIQFVTNDGSVNNALILSDTAGINKNASYLFVVLLCDLNCTHTKDNSYYNTYDDSKFAETSDMKNIRYFSVYRYYANILPFSVTLTYNNNKGQKNAQQVYQNITRESDGASYVNNLYFVGREDSNYNYTIREGSWGSSAATVLFIGYPFDYDPNNI